MQYVNNFEDVKLLDMANGEKLESWGKYLLIRPDPQIIWSEKTNPKLWSKADAKYIRSKTGGGHWETKTKLPDSWQVAYKDLIFNVKPMGFKHTGLFPEQAVNWEYMMEKIKKRKEQKQDTKVLNLFAYTGGATVACLAAGATVCHVDSSKGMVAWAKENVSSSGLKEKSVRFIVDDVLKFVKREVRRGNKYDGIIMDPPSYGRGASGEVWSIEENLEELIDLCTMLLSPTPAFFLINTYTGGLSGTVISNVLKMAMTKNANSVLKLGNIVTDEIGIKMEGSDFVLPCGITTKWEERSN